MTRTIAKTSGQQQALLNRIAAVSIDTAPEKFPPIEATEDLVMTMRRKAEGSFQSALSQRTWWRLSDDERAHIRAKVLADNPLYRKHGGYGLEVGCYEEVGRLLADERAHGRAAPSPAK